MAQKEDSQVMLSSEKLFANSIKTALPQIRGVAASMIDGERLMRLALLCATKNPLLYKCTGESVALALMQSSEIGLEIGSALNHAYLVPRWSSQVNGYEAQLMISAFGYAELAYRSGKLRALWWYPVYRGDDFSRTFGDTPRIFHEPSEENEEDSNLTHVYAVAELMTGGKILHVLSRKQVERLMMMNDAVKKNKFSPWTDHFAEMALAKVVKAVCKRLPKSKELAVAMSIDNAAETGKPELADSSVAMLPEPNPLTRADRVAGRMGVTVEENTSHPDDLNLDGYDGPRVSE